jgi:hypothetical protein
MNKGDEETKEAKKSEDNMAKIAITKDADRMLVDLVHKLNDGFTAGRATKQDLATLLISQFAKDFSDTSLHELRAHFFDPIQLWEAQLRKAKETGELPKEVREMLYQQFLGQGSNAKRTKKNLNTDIIKDNVPSKEAA